MYSDLECGICCWTFNAGRRCPRELRCRHTFCERCLRALARPLEPEEERPEADTVIVCPLCRHTTSISGEGKVRAELRVDEGILERLLASGVLDREEEEDDPEEEEGQHGCDDTEEIPVTQAEESDLSSGSRGGRLRRSCRKIWRSIIGKNSPPRDRQSKFIISFKVVDKVNNVTETKILRNS